MKWLVFIPFLVICLNSNCQVNLGDCLKYEHATYGVNESSFARYMSDSIQFDDIVLEDTVPQNLYMSFVIDTLGNLNSIEVIRSSGSLQIDYECERILRGMPPWNPARCDGKPIEDRFTMPFRVSVH